MVIKNRNSLLKQGSTKPKKVAIDLFEAGISAALPERAIKNHLRLEEDTLISGQEEYNLANLDRIIVIGGGKASFGMARAVESAIGSAIYDGLIVTKEGGKGGSLKDIEVREASHPVPDEAGVEATEYLLDLARSAGSRDLVIVLISGGGSALLSCPIEEIELRDLQNLTDDLLESGATIEEINTLRKRLSRIKGGRLAKAVNPAEGLSLVVSDVVGDNPRFIASGPTVPEDSSPEDALEVMEKYNLTERNPKVTRLLNEGKSKTEPVSREKFAEFKFKNQIVVSNETGLSAMAKKAKELNIDPVILSSRLKGESQEVGSVFGQLTRSISEENHPISRPALLLSGGETTVTLPEDHGTGGPNQEFALTGGREIIGTPDSAIGAIDSDGEDGSTEIAGGLVTGEAEISRDEINSSLENHDTSSLLEELGGAIITGQTGTNVNDLRLGLVL